MRKKSKIGIKEHFHYTFIYIYMYNDVEMFKDRTSLEIYIK